MKESEEVVSRGWLGLVEIVVPCAERHREPFQAWEPVWLVSLRTHSHRQYHPPRFLHNAMAQQKIEHSHSVSPDTALSPESKMAAISIPLVSSMILHH